MSLLKYTKVLLQTPGLGSVAICLVGLSVGVIVVSHWARSAYPSSVHSTSPTAKGALQTATSSSTTLGESKVAPPSTSFLSVFKPARAATGRTGKPSGSRLDRVIFQQTIASDELGFLTEDVGKPANDVLHEQKVRQLVDLVVPYAPVHLGLDMPLANAIESMFHASQAPVEIRDGRYVMVSGRRGNNGRGRAFLWVDMQEGIGLGGIFFYPSNGEPTPALTIVSRQVRNRSVRLSQLPVAFVQDLGRWAAAEGVPPVTTRYFINASSQKTVLAHDENVCQDAQGGLAPAAGTCEKMKADAAEIDQKAAFFLGQTHYASNATMHMVSGPFATSGHMAP